MVEYAYGGPIEIFLIPASAVPKAMVFAVCRLVHIKEPLLQIRKSSLCSGSSRWSFTICLMPYNRKFNVLNVLLNKTFPSLIRFNNVLIMVIST